MTDETVFNVREFDIHSMYPRDVNDAAEVEAEGGSKIALIGRPGSGKSRMMAFICYMKKHQFPAACVVNGNEDSNHAYEKAFPKTLIHTELTEELIENVRQRQNTAKKYLTNSWLLFVKDDCIDTDTHFRKPAIERFYKRARHWNVFSILGLQYAIELPKAVRVCIDYCFIFREPNIEFREILYRNFASIIPSKKLFYKLMDEITGDHTALVINNRSQSNNPEDCVFYYNADKVPEGFKFGCEDMWLFDKQRLYEEDNDDANSQ